MKPHLTPRQGRIVRALGFYLSKVGKDSMTVGPSSMGMTVESVETVPWASLTFAGERHRLVVHLPGAPPTAQPIDGSDLVVPGAIVAVEGACWNATAGGTRLTIDLLAVASR